MDEGVWRIETARNIRADQGICEALAVGGVKTSALELFSSSKTTVRRFLINYYRLSPLGKRCDESRREGVNAGY